MRIAFALAVLLAFTPPASANECITATLDVRHADVVASARYAGERTFIVESILRTAGAHPSELVAPKDWRARPCSPPLPVAGQLYFVVLYPNRTLGYREYERATMERRLISRVHAVTTRSILATLRSYSNRGLSRASAQEWLTTAVIEPRRDDSFAQELLDRAEELLNHMSVSEACHKNLIRSLQTTELPEALHAIETIVPAVDTEDEFVRKETAAITDPAQLEAAKDDASDKWDEILGAVDNALHPILQQLTALPWCDPEKYGW